MCIKTFLFLFFKYFTNSFLERREGRGEERETNIDVREKHWSYVPLPVTKLTTQAFDLMRNWTGNLLLCGMMPNQLSHTGQGSKHF